MHESLKLSMYKTFMNNICNINFSITYFPKTIFIILNESLNKNKKVFFFYSKLVKVNFESKYIKSY